MEVEGGGGRPGLQIGRRDMCFYLHVDLQTIFRFEVIFTLVALKMNGQMIGVEDEG